jgi:hypothetical protein
MKQIGRGLAVVVIVLAAQVALAGVYQYQPPDDDMYDLTHQKAYRWGINPGIPEGEDIVGAEIFFDNIRNWQSNDPNDLYVTLLDTASSGLTVYTDNQGGGDYFAGDGPLLVHYQDLPSTPQDITYTFDAGEVATLNGYVADGNFGLGIDPDCHFYNDGITLTLETECSPPDGPPVPEPLAGSILLGGLGMIAARRKRS